MDSYLGSTGIRLEGVCPQCDGDGIIAATDRSCYHPDKYPDELIACPKCNGVGGDSPEAGEQGRKASAAYFDALGLNEPEAPSDA